MTSCVATKWGELDDGCADHRPNLLIGRREYHRRRRRYYCRV